MFTIEISIQYYSWHVSIVRCLTVAIADVSSSDGDDEERLFNPSRSKYGKLMHWNLYTISYNPVS